jgi:penicillin-binding protein 2
MLFSQFTKTFRGHPGRIFLLGWLLLILSACGALAGSSAENSEGASVSSILPFQQAPEDVIKAFLDAWGQRNYEAMYANISAESKELYPFPVFQTTYETADTEIQLESLTYTLSEAQLQGATAAVNYDLTITSPVFGTIEDAGRVMRLIRNAEGWRVAWSSMDIFNGLTGGSRIRVEALREPRANIYDRNGEVMVEQRSTVVSLYVSRGEIFDEALCLDILANILLVQRGDLVELFNGYNFETVFYVGETSPDVFAAREAELTENCSIRTLERETRRYVGHGAAAHLTGYIGQIPAEEVQRYVEQGYNAGDLVGRAGIEAAYEDALAGQAERVLRIVEPGGTTLRELAGTSGTPPQPLTLTVDRDLQLATGQALADAFNFAEGNWANRSHSLGGAAVVVDVNSGAILAMASYPTFDPGVFNPDTYVVNPGFVIADLNADQRSPLVNRVTQIQQPPGSTFKVVTTVAAAAEDVFGTNEIFPCGLEWDGRPFGDTLPPRSDWKKTDGLPPTGDINISQALASSCDPFYYQMGAELFNDRGPATLVDYARHLGLGRKTGLEAAFAEAAGNIVPPRNVSEAINNAIGQGDVQATPLQMAMMTSVVANGGTLYKPYLVQQIGGLDGTEVSFQAEPTVLDNISMDEEALEATRRGMCLVTTDYDYGTAWFVFDDPENGIPTAPYTVCGKTGTAQTARIEPHAWFVAYAPAENPEVAIAVMVEHSREGSEVAAPIVRRILDHYFNAPIAPYPNWWIELEYIPLNIPVGGTGGG